MHTKHCIYALVSEHVLRVCNAIKDFSTLFLPCLKQYFWEKFWEENNLSLKNSFLALP